MVRKIFLLIVNILLQRYSTRTHFLSFELFFCTSERVLSYIKGLRDEKECDKEGEFYRKERRQRIETDRLE